MNGFDVLAVMDRYERADALAGLPGFDRRKYLIADAARSFQSLGIAFCRDPLAVKKCRAEAMRRYAALRLLRRGDA
jgi:hypothetical protein